MTSYVKEVLQIREQETVAVFSGLILVSVLWQKTLLSQEFVESVSAFPPRLKVCFVVTGNYWSLYILTLYAPNSRGAEVM